MRWNLLVKLKLRRVIDMTLEERIEQEKFKARVDRIKANRRIFHNNDEDKIEAFILRAKEHEQLAEWLEELKAYREIGTVEECKNSVLNILKAHNKALNNLVNACEKQFTTMYGQRYVDIRDIVYIAEQLKAGEDE